MFNVLVHGEIPDFIFSIKDNGKIILDLINIHIRTNYPEISDRYQIKESSLHFYTNRFMFVVLVTVFSKADYNILSSSSEISPEIIFESGYFNENGIYVSEK